MPLLKHRPGSADEAIWSSVNREYRLPALLCSSDVVLDIRAHIGGFADQVLARGAGLCASYEADPELAAMAAENLKPYGSRAKVVASPVWGFKTTLRFQAATNLNNTGVGYVNSAHGREVQTAAFDEIVSEFLPAHGRIRLVKMDCEGGEWSILWTSKKLHLIDEMQGEIHEARRYPKAHGKDISHLTRKDVKAALEQAGFIVDIVDAHNHTAANFFARRA
jgi:FkbM family methyltransferase